MNSFNNITLILNAVKEGTLSIEEAKQKLNTYIDIGFAQIDIHRERRTGFPEVIYGEGKSLEQILEIFERLYNKNNVVLATRINEQIGMEVVKRFSGANYDKIGKTILWMNSNVEKFPGYIVVVSAGTSDLPVARECIATISAMGSRFELICDVGVAGLHRLVDKINIIREANVIVVIAGMEGALPSVVGGLVNKPVIAVPTSVGYGSNFQGLSALLGMLNSCANGISVVNIDNGYGAGYQAGLINKLIYAKKGD